LRDVIVSMIPAHTCYVEVFGGAAWVLFGKPPGISKSEVLNDLDGELANFWRVIKHRPAEFTEAVSWLMPSRELFDEAKDLPGIGGEIRRAVQFYYVLRLSYGGRRVNPSYGFKLKRRPDLWWATEKDEVLRVIERLRGVWVERLVWEQCIARFARKHSRTFFYLDPPYRAPGARSYRHWFTDEDHARLADVLRGIRHSQWLLSYNDDPFIRRLYRGRGVSFIRVRTRYTVAGGTKQGKIGHELLIANYSI